ncbi:hypothetical protein PGH47_09060 [Streptomyces sp. HUAS 31]|uniref:hypothetical protein n=1 Tax=Streptomyces TaxID=1883 RepID=UPI0023057737|nr:hypothetical protein [Streptomyces sp. HUAS 31]WCD95803.1 hypothetical protein PGH47_09060 [Streptomyces sp. HUAS 31]
MDEEAITIRLTRDQAFVLSDWLYQVMFQSDDLEGIVSCPTTAYALKPPRSVSALICKAESASRRHQAKPRPTHHKRTR